MMGHGAPWYIRVIYKVCFLTSNGVNCCICIFVSHIGEKCVKMWVFSLTMYANNGLCPAKYTTSSFISIVMGQSLGDMTGDILLQKQFIPECNKTENNEE